MLRDYKPDLKKVSISIANALEEDIGLGDVTGELINANLSIQAKLICREETVLCGTQWFTEAFKQLDPNISCLLYTSPSPRDATLSRMPSSA